MTRIKINGVWYVPETQHIDLDPVRYEACIVENSEVSFEASRLYKDDDSFFDDIDIKYIDKTGDVHQQEFWDNNKWMIGVLSDDPESLADLPNMSDDNKRFLKVFLQYLLDRGWLSTAETTPSVYPISEPIKVAYCAKF